METKRLTEVPVLEQAAEQTHLLVEHDGETRRLPADGLLGGFNPIVGTDVLIGGTTNNEENTNSVVIGVGARAKATEGEGSAVAVGCGAVVGLYGVSIGGYATAENSGVAIGDTTMAGNSAVALGGCSAAANSFAVGVSWAEASKPYTMAIGDEVSSNYEKQISMGWYNESKAGNLFNIGHGYHDDETDAEEFTNAFEVTENGDVNAEGAFNPNGCDYAEMFEWQDGNPETEDRIGYVVTLDGEKIRLAQAGDDVLGIISGTVAILGDSSAMHWKDKYVTDEFGRIVYDMVEEFGKVKDRKTGEVTKESIGFFKHPRINPDYNPDEKYVPREQRPEWGKVGLMGKLYVRDDGTCVAGGYATVGTDGVLTNSETATNIRVMKRTGDNIVWVLLK